MKKILFIVVCCLCLCGCEDSNKTNINNTFKENNNSDTTQQEKETKTNNSKPALDKAFNFDDLEITIGSSYSFVAIDNHYSEHHNSSVVKLPVTIKNLKDETHSLNMFYFNLFGSKGTELDNIASYFDDSIDYAGDLRTGASYTKYFYLLYDGDGTYSIEFDDLTNKITIDIDIKK